MPGVTGAEPSAPDAAPLAESVQTSVEVVNNPVPLPTPDEAAEEAAVEPEEEEKGGPPPLPVQAMRWLHERLTSRLSQLGWDVLPSQANFILAACPGGNGKATYRGLYNQGILVRYFDLPGLKDKVRITVGSVQENNALLAGIRALPAAGKAA